MVCIRVAHKESEKVDWFKSSASRISAVGGPRRKSKRLARRTPAQAVGRCLSLAAPHGEATN